MNKTFLSLAIAASLGFAASAQAADIKLINQDAPGVGLNDTTPVAPVGGNPGKTRGEQARIVYQFAMDMWGGVLESSQTINVYASFAPLNCSATSGTLAQAGANWTFNLTDNNGVTRRYGSALADAVIGMDLFGYFKALGQIPAGYEDDYGDIFSQFNGKLGQPGCLDGMEWYFGLDGNTPAGKVNFLNTVMHEIGHGLGVQGFLNKSTGALSSGISDPYTYYAYDNVLNRGFEQMTNAQRATAMRTPGRTVWTGPGVNSTAELILSPLNALKPSAPAEIAGEMYEVGVAAFGPVATPATFPDGKLVLIDDGDANGGSVTDGCSDKGANTGLGDTITYVNADEVAGNIAVIDRGLCSFEYKAKIAEDNGAVAVIIVNNTTGVNDMAAVSPSTGVSIPAVMVSQADGAKLKQYIADARAGMGLASWNAGTDTAGRVRLYSPTTVASGSTFSHFDTVVAPDALMEPFDSEAVQANYTADLTPGLFWDIGWDLNASNGKMFNNLCDTGVPAVTDSGFVIGSNLQAMNRVCRIGANKTTYYNCMNSHATKLQSLGLITSSQKTKIQTCARRESDNWGR